MSNNNGKCSTPILACLWFWTIKANLVPTQFLPVLAGINLKIVFSCTECLIIMLILAPGGPFVYPEDKQKKLHLSPTLIRAFYCLSQTRKQRNDPFYPAWGKTGHFFIWSIFTFFHPKYTFLMIGLLLVYTSSNKKDGKI